MPFGTPHFLRVVRVVEVGRSEFTEEGLDAVHMVHIRVRLKVSEYVCDAVGAHVADGVHGMAFLLEVTADAAVHFRKLGEYRLRDGLGSLGVADVDNGLVPGVVLYDGAVPPLSRSRSESWAFTPYSWSKAASMMKRAYRLAASFTVRSVTHDIHTSRSPVVMSPATIAAAGGAAADQPM